MKKPEAWKPNATAPLTILYPFYLKVIWWWRREASTAYGVRSLWTSQNVLSESTYIQRWALFVRRPTVSRQSTDRHSVARQVFPLTDRHMCRLVDIFVIWTQCRVSSDRHEFGKLSKSLIFDTFRDRHFCTYYESSFTLSSNEPRRFFAICTKTMQNIEKCHKI